MKKSHYRENRVKMGLNLFKKVSLRKIPNIITTVVYKLKIFETV